MIALLVAMILAFGAFACAEAPADADGIVSQEEWDAAVEAEGSSGDKDDWVNILLLGCDSYTTNDRQRTDSMIIFSINTKTNEVKMTSLMRDTWIQVPGKKSHRKLTELCAVGGPEATMKAINDCYDMDIQDYMLISMEGIAEIIDLLGGLELDITEAERKALNKGLFDLSGLSGMEQLKESGEQVHLNGNQATAYARIRQIDSDYVRVERQRIVLMAMAKKIMSGVNATNVISVIDVLMEYVDTNIGLMEIISLARLGLGADMEKIQEMRLPAEGTYEAGMFGDVWCIKPDFKKNTKALHEFIYN
jgi:LCP family protein required for cell wall assembly